jgi:hypothetical protein
MCGKVVIESKMSRVHVSTAVFLDRQMYKFKKLQRVLSNCVILIAMEPKYSC